MLYLGAIFFFLQNLNDNDNLLFQISNFAFLITSKRILIVYKFWLEIALNILNKYYKIFITNGDQNCRISHIMV